MRACFLCVRYGRPLYGDVFGKSEYEQTGDELVNRALWGELG